MEAAPLIFSIVGALFGLVATTLMGVMVAGQSEIKRSQAELSQQFFAHVTASSIHEAGLVRLEEQVKNVLAIAKIAHERADRMEADLKGS